MEHEMFSGQGEFFNRHAIIFRHNDGGWWVEAYENMKLVKSIDLSKHSLYYAQNTADNWIHGILNQFVGLQLMIGRVFD